LPVIRKAEGMVSEGTRQNRSPEAGPILFPIVKMADMAIDLVD
jgi:hypothetical protein